MRRRSFLVGAAALGAARALDLRVPTRLLAPDDNGVELPAGYRSRVVARSGETVAGTTHTWHAAPDGGAVFAAPGGGWVYASNSEVDDGGGGVGVLRFAADGELTGAGAVLTGTRRNCAGGPTPWGTWLSCEEVADGQVWECDPFGRVDAVARPAMGRFRHEAAAVDPEGSAVYLTEDEGDGCYYRFRPRAYPDLADGVLEAAAVGTDGAVQWVPIEDPTGRREPTRRQAQRAGATMFAGGEGCWFDRGTVVFTTKGDDKVWRHELAADRITVLYDAATHEHPVLRGVDNVTVTPAGDLLVAEDGGDMELVLVSADGRNVLPFLRIPGQIGVSELTGPALAPSGTRLYVSSQRGAGSGGITYEISGPFGAGGPATIAATEPAGGSGSVWPRAALGLGALAALAAVAGIRASDRSEDS